MHHVLSMREEIQEPPSFLWKWDLCFSGSHEVSWNVLGVPSSFRKFHVFPEEQKSFCRKSLEFSWALPLAKVDDCFQVVVDFCRCQFELTSMFPNAYRVCHMERGDGNLIFVLRCNGLFTREDVFKLQVCLKLCEVRAPQQALQRITNFLFLCMTPPSVTWR